MLQQRLDTVFELKAEFVVMPLCRVLRVNRSTYYKQFFAKDSTKAKKKSGFARSDTYFKHKQAVVYIVYRLMALKNICIYASLLTYLPAKLLKGYPFDNTVAQYFLNMPNKKQISRHVCKSIEEVNLASFEHIDGEFNCKRLHHHNNFKKTISVENNYFNAQERTAQLE